MGEFTQITGGDGILTSRIGNSWVIELDPHYLNQSTPTSAPMTPTSTSLLTYPDKHDEQAIAESWSSMNTGNTEGLQLTVQTGMAYEPNGDRTIYGFVRDLTFNADGQLVSVSAERRIVIDIPEAC